MASPSQEGEEVSALVYDSLSSNSNNNHEDQTRPFISRHRKVLDRIAVDSVASRRYELPSTYDATATSEEEESLHSHNSGDNNNFSNSNRRKPRNATLVWLQNWLLQSFYSINSNNNNNNNNRGGGSNENPYKQAFLRYCLPPCYTSWLSTYNVKENLLNDVIAGLSVGVMVVPQSMSYAKLAGLPVEFGLYSSFSTTFAYSLFGTSKQLAVGPVALLSLMLNTGLNTLLKADGIDQETDPELFKQRYISLAIQTSFLVGITYIGMGFLRLGFVTIFLSHAVVSGFTTGAAVIIGLSQIKYIFGYNIERSDRIYEILYSLFEHIQEVNFRTLLMGTISIAVLVFMKNIGKSYPHLSWIRALGPLTVTTIGIILSFIFGFSGSSYDSKVAVVDTIPSGLPSLTISEWLPIQTDFGRLYVIVLSIVIVGFMESIAIAKQLASKHKYEIDASTELIGLGMANFVGGMFQAYPVTGSFSRSAVNNESGAQSGLAGMVTATTVMLTLLLLTPLFEKLPLNVLAAIVISGVLGLIDTPEAKYLYKVHKFDFAVWLVSCGGTMILGVEIGLAIAVGVSLLLVIYESANPHMAVLGRLPGTSYYRSVQQYANAETYDGIVIVRIDGPLNFANGLSIRENIRKYRVAAENEFEQKCANNLLSPTSENSGQAVQFVILECSAVSHIDTSALHELENMNTNHLSRNQQLVFSNPNQLVMMRFESSGLIDKVGRQHFFPALHDAVQFCLQAMDSRAQDMWVSQGKIGPLKDTSDEDEEEGSTRV